MLVDLLEDILAGVIGDSHNVGVKRRREQVAGGTTGDACCPGNVVREVLS